MEEYFQLCSCLFTLVALFFAWYITTFLKSGGSGKKNLPPSPPRLPVIGNLHQMGKLPHRSLWNLSRKYGPLMFLHLGSKPTLVVSSAEAAKEILKTHDLACAGKPAMSAPRKIFYDLKDLLNLSYGDEWRKLRSIFVQLLNSKRVKAYYSILVEETILLMEKIEDCSASSKPVNLTDMFPELTYDLISRAAFGKKQGKKFLESIEESVGLLANFTLGEFVPQLDWINRFNGFNAALDRGVEARDVILDALIEDHLNGSLESRPNGDCRKTEENFLDSLIRIYKGGSPNVSSTDMITVKGAILDVFGAGTETSATTLVWVMTELIKHPIIMKKLQEETRELMKGKQHINEIDLQKMHYLKAVIKETFRLHPPVAIYYHASREHVKVMGYDVAPDTMIIINAWAIGRDPACWDEPEKFKPERFLNSDLDFRGFDFQLIPFGAGRRICPGLGLAAATIEHTIANLVHMFDWALPDGAKGEDLDVTEKAGLTIGKKSPLIVVASLSSNK